MITHRLMTERYEAIVRLLYAQGRASAADLLSLYRAQPLTAKGLYAILDELAGYGWVSRVHDHRRHGARAVAWVVADEVRAHLQQPARLPLHPGHLPPGAAATRRAPPAPPARRGPVTPPTYRAAPQPYVPPPAAPLRPGALDFLAHPSHGACR